MWPIIKLMISQALLIEPATLRLRSRPNKDFKKAQMKLRPNYLKADRISNSEDKPGANYELAVEPSIYQSLRTSSKN